MYRSLLFIVCSLFSFSQLFAQRTIAGKVTDCEGEPLEGATVMIKGTDTGTFSDENGFYTIMLSKELDKPDHALIFDYMGMESKTVNIENEDTINVKLVEEYLIIECYSIERHK